MLASAEAVAAFSIVCGLAETAVPSTATLIPFGNENLRSEWRRGYSNGKAA